MRLYGIIALSHCAELLLKTSCPIGSRGIKYHHGSELPHSGSVGQLCALPSSLRPKGRLPGPALSRGPCTAPAGRVHSSATEVASSP